MHKFYKYIFINIHLYISFLANFIINVYTNIVLNIDQRQNKKILFEKIDLI